MIDLLFFSSLFDVGSTHGLPVSKYPTSVVELAPTDSDGVPGRM